MVSRSCFVCEISTPCDNLGLSRLAGYMRSGRGVYVLLEQGIEIYVLTFSILFLMVLGTGGRLRSQMLLGPGLVGVRWPLWRGAVLSCWWGQPVWWWWYMFEGSRCWWIALWNCVIVAWRLHDEGMVSGDHEMGAGECPGGGSSWFVSYWWSGSAQRACWLVSFRLFLVLVVYRERFLRYALISTTGSCWRISWDSLEMSGW